jgi:uncharacterized protein YecE (DUF72 family)
MKTYVGCCSKTVPWDKYAKIFDAVEINSTFYKLPEEETVRRWVDETKGSIIFCMKAFQGITHPISSPTWKRAGKQRPKNNVENYGYLKPTRENFDCWDNILKICKAMNARVCVIQLPPSFDCNDKNLENALTFFSSINRDDLVIGIEFRHISWFTDSNNSKVIMLLDKANLIHIVDPFALMLLKHGELIYFRMHGIHNVSKNGQISYNYNYEYSNEELERLKKMVESLNAKEAFVMFNNINMHDDALRFKVILHVTSSNYS